ncbi:MAG: hypothetical protein AB1586_03395 [Pseudomonadota bacterium]|jgi:hypothetical protein
MIVSPPFPLLRAAADAPRRQTALINAGRRIAACRVVKADPLAGPVDVKGSGASGKASASGEGGFIGWRRDRADRAADIGRIGFDTSNAAPAGSSHFAVTFAVTAGKPRPRACRIASGRSGGGRAAPRCIDPASIQQSQAQGVYDDG